MVCFCACTCRVTHRHTKTSEPWCPSIFGLSSSFTASNSPPSAGHSELLTMATYVPTARAREMPLGHALRSTQTHTHNSLAGMTRSAWKAVCVSAWIRAMYQVSSQRSTVTVWRNMAENEKMRKTERGLQTHIQANTSLHTPSFTRWDLFYGLATMKNTYKNTFLTTAGVWCGVAVNRSLTQEQTWNKVKGEPSTGTIALLQHLVKHFVSWGIRLHTECPQGGQWRNYYLPIYNNRRDRNRVENRQHIKVTRTL